MEKKIKKIVELKIEDNDIIFDELGLEVVSLVEQPAIEIDWRAFSKEQFIEKKSGESKEDFIGRCMSKLVGDEGYDNDQAYAICINQYESFDKVNEVELESYNDYPDDVKNNAKKVIEWVDKNGWGSCGTDVGKQRANQLAKGENISVETIKRMYSYLSRHEVDLESSTSYSDGCGKLMYDAWGGKSALSWSRNKLRELGLLELENEVELEEIVFEDCSFSIEDQKYTLEKAQQIGEIIAPEDIYLELKEQKFSFIKDILKGLAVIDSLTTSMAADDDEGETYYRYAGDMASRNFCKAMQRINKIYTKNDILQMQRNEINADFGHKGNPYSIWKYKGGVYCKHYWSELQVFKGVNGQKVIIDLGPVNGLPGQKPRDMANGGHHPNWKPKKQQMSINDEKRIVVGPLLVPNKMIERIDEFGNPYYVFFSRETIKKVSEKFFKENKHNNTDINHDDIITNKNTLLESWIIEDTIHDKSFTYGFRLPKGTWMASYKINDEQTWNLIKEGKLNGFSIAGYFAEKSGAERQSEMTLQKIIELLNEVE